ncbi:MAG: hypothetical protein ACT4N2_16315 [Hyphomicrobium sp.]
MVTPSAPFDRASLERAFSRLGEIAGAEGRVVEISIYGGSALLLVFDFRTATRDVDAVFEADRSFVRRAAAKVAEEFGWGANWINDGVKGFLSARDAESGAKVLVRSYMTAEGTGLRILVPTPAYLFAMKCLAMRIGGIEDSQDVDDIRQLGRVLGITSSSAAIAIVSQYYPAKRISPKTQFGLEEIFDAASGDPA